MEKLDKGLFRMTSYVADQAGCANIRVIIPFILLNQLHIPNFQFQAYFNNLFTKDIAFYNHSAIIQFQRSATQRHLELFELIRKKIKIFTRSALVYEIDDDLFNIPKWNFAADYYKPYKPYITEMLSKSDGLIVSTEKLKELYSPYNSNIHIIPNHLPRFTWGEPVFNERETNRPRVLYPCSSNHFACRAGVEGGDMGKKLIEFIRKTTEDYEWIFVGGLPLELDDLAKEGKIRRYGWYSVYEYPRVIKGLKGDIGIAPLQMNKFNESKSNIKALEYTAMGIPAVFTKIAPYDKMIAQAATDEEFISHIETFRDLDNRKNAWTHTYEKLKDDLFWEDNDYRNLKKYVRTYLALIGKEANF